MSLVKNYPRTVVLYEKFLFDTNLSSDQKVIYAIFHTLNDNTEDPIETVALLLGKTNSFVMKTVKNLIKLGYISQYKVQGEVVYQL